MKLRVLSQREKIFVGLTLMTAAVTFLWGVVLEPLGLRWRTINRQIADNQNYLRKNSALLLGYDALKNNYRDVVGMTALAQQDQDTPAETLAHIQEISAAASCVIKNVKPRAPKALGKYQEAAYEVVAEGGIDQLANFIYQLETSPRMLKIKRFTLLSRSESAQQLKGTFVIGKLISSRAAVAAPSDAAPNTSTEPSGEQPEAP